MTEFGLAMHSHHERDMRVLISTVADVMVILVFITLGANLPWGDISGNLAPALAVVATLEQYVPERVDAHKKKKKNSAHRTRRARARRGDTSRLSRG